MDLLEAKRILKKNGYRLLEEVETEIPDIDEVMEMIESIEGIIVKNATLKDIPNAPKIIKVLADDKPGNYIGEVRYDSSKSDGINEKTWIGTFLFIGESTFKAIKKLGYDIDYHSGWHELDEFLNLLKTFVEFYDVKKIRNLAGDIFNKDTYDEYAQWYDGKHYNGD